MSNKKKVLFVDDEPNVLSAMKRMLRFKSDEWDMIFVDSGTKALAEIESGYCDVIVSDIRMPGMDGAELLTKVKEESPTTIRIALSGQVDLNEVIRSIKAVHQYISKPCDADDLVSKIEGVLQSREVLTDTNLLRLVTNIDALPVMPKVFYEIEEELAKKEPSIEKIAICISTDVGFVAKMLKLVNSPYFGLQTSVDSLQKAITMLGLNTIKALILSSHMFSMYNEKQMPELSISLLWDHCFRVSNIARLIAKAEGMDRKSVAECRMAGLLHDIGKLVLISSFTKEYRCLLQNNTNSGRLVWEAEKETFGATHAEVGAYLMGLWGLPGNLVYGIGHHHDRVSKESPIALIIHIADLIDHHFFIIHEGYAKGKLAENLNFLEEDESKLKMWLEYIKDNWDYWDLEAENVDRGLLDFMSGGIR